MNSSREWFRRPSGVQTRWASFENPTAAKGNGGRTNRGAKGRPAQKLAAGEAVTLLDATGSGLINRIWMTINDRSPQMLRSLRLDMFWDDSETPAVSAPLGDFFGVALGRRVAFASELFSDPEGRSFNCFVPMPFRSSARITLTNESARDLSHLFYDVNFLLDVEHEPDVLYFHAHWRRENPNLLGQNYTILPKVQGSGRFLGSNLGVITAPIYGRSWWGEGEIKIWLDGDGEFPTLCGTGTEDYIGSAWAQDLFSHPTQGCTIVDAEKGHNAFYRYHTIDPIYFSHDCRVAIQTMGGDPEAAVAKLQQAGAPLELVSIHAADQFTPLLEGEPATFLGDSSREAGFANFYRQDDWCSTAYFYLNHAHNDLPELADVRERVLSLD